MTNNSIDVLVSMDTTGSTYPCASQMRRNVRQLVSSLFTTVPNLKLGIVVHKDWCNRSLPYHVRMLDLTNDEIKIERFLNDIGDATGGRGSQACYELALQCARQATWRAGKSKIFVMVGDEIPNTKDSPHNEEHIDWKNEVGLLKELGVKIISVQCLNERHSPPFYQKCADETGGYYLRLDQMAHIQLLVSAICYKQDSEAAFERFETSLQTSGKMNRDVDNFISILAGRKTSKRYTSSAESLGAVPPTRFQIIPVDYDCAIKEFVLNQGLNFKRGRGFYEFTKKEKVQDYKEIVLQDRLTGDMYYGDKVTVLMRGDSGDSKGKINPNINLQQKYRIFVQSTSVNRRLIGGTLFLYEVENWQ